MARASKDDKESDPRRFCVCLFLLQGVGGWIHLHTPCGARDLLEGKGQRQLLDSSSNIVGGNKDQNIKKLIRKPPKRTWGTYTYVYIYDIIYIKEKQEKKNQLLC